MPAVGAEGVDFVDGADDLAVDEPVQIVWLPVELRGQPSSQGGFGGLTV